MKQGRGRRLRLPVYVVLLLLAVAGCSRKVYVPVEKDRVVRDTVSVERVRVDSVYSRDSVVVSARGDTVFVDRWRWRYRDRESGDTVFRSASDTVRIPEPYSVYKEVKVDRPLGRWKTAVLSVGYAALGAVSVSCCILLLRFLRKFKKT